MQKLRGVEIVNLANNKLREVPPGIFRQLHSLTELNLEANHLRQIPADFKHMAHLNNLNLARNAIERFDVALIHPSMSGELNLAQNRIKSFVYVSLIFAQKKTRSYN